MPQKLKLAVAQSRTLPTLSVSLSSLSKTTHEAASQGVDLLLFPEAFLGGYPRKCSFGSAIGSRSDAGREQFLQYFRAAIDLGDTPQGAGDGWVDRKLPTPKDRKYRGDGTREFIERVASETGVFLAVGLVEKAGGSLYCSCVYVCPRLGCIGKRRKVMPTATERLIWAQGSPSTLRAVTTVIRGVRLTLAAAICWENYMPLLRQALYAQNVNLYLAPTADARDTWEALMRTVALEGRTFVLSANQCTREKDLPEWSTRREEEEEGDHALRVNGLNAAGGEVTNEAPLLPQTSTSSARRKSIAVTEDRHELCLPAATKSNPHEGALVEQMTQRQAKLSSPFLCRGGSCIVHPTGALLQGPLWDDPGSEENGCGTLLVNEVDFEDCIRGRLDFDAAGSYSRNDAFRLSVEGLDLNPPA